SSSMVRSCTSGLVVDQDVQLRTIELDLDTVGGLDPHFVRLDSEVLEDWLILPSRDEPEKELPPGDPEVELVHVPGLIEDRLFKLELALRADRHRPLRLRP